ncbi:MAG: hypothetical protein EOP84_19585, partial [Verrucomicrobiaceae bacterium]
HEATVIDADKGYTAGAEKSGTIRLQKGKHPFRLAYVHRGGARPNVSLQWSSEATPKQAIPESAFFRTEY